METKKCSKCGRELPLNQFNWRNKSKGTRRADCKECHSGYMKNHYQEKKQLIQELKEKDKCAKCGETRGYVLDYHHVNPEEKEDTIARMTSNNYRLDKVMSEIQKCICLCSNCHREFHHFESLNGITIEEYLADTGGSNNGQFKRL